MAKERSRSRSSYSYSSYSSERRPSKATPQKEDKGGRESKTGKASEAAPGKTNGGKPSKVKDAPTRSGPKDAELGRTVETKVALDNLQEMLVERQQELTKESNPDRRKDIEKDIEILKQWQKDGAPKGEDRPRHEIDKSTSKATGDHSKATEKEQKHASKAELKEKASKSEAKQVKQPKEDPKKGKTSGEKAPKEPKEAKSAAKAEKASKKASSNEVKQKTKGDTGGKRKESEEPLARKRVDKPAGEHAQKEKDEKEAGTTAKQVAPQVEAKQAKTKENPKEKLLQSAEMIEQAKEALRHLKQKATEAAEAAPVPEEPMAGLPAEDAEEALTEMTEDKVTVLMPAEKAPPCELPLWCVMPNPRDVETVFEVVRIVLASTAPPKRLQLGRRSWALLGRRLHEAQAAEARKAGIPQPDIGLACPLSSKAHALVMQNWTGKIFLQDLGSAHGTFLGGVRLKPHEPCEWKPGVQACFADPQLEFFELRVAEKTEQ